MGTSAPARQLKSVVYGPVSSWRLGRSLGIDLLSRPKTCSFDCIYCQLGPTQHHTARRAVFVATRRVVREVEALPALELDFVTFSGMGEPTLAANLGEAIAEVKQRLRRPVAVLTNSSLLGDAAVRAELCWADVVVAKLDAPDEGLFREINRPAAGVTFEAMLEGLRRLREEHCGRFAVQVMLCARNASSAARIAGVVASLRPDEVQLNTPLRPSATPPLEAREMMRMRDAFRGLPLTCVYEARKAAAQPLDPCATAARRPEG